MNEYDILKEWRNTKRQTEGQKAFYYMWNKELLALAKAMKKCINSGSEMPREWVKKCCRPSYKYIEEILELCNSYVSNNILNNNKKILPQDPPFTFNQLKTIKRKITV